MSLGALIFDVDGTLAETEEYHRLAFNRAFEEAGLTWFWDEDLYRDLLRTTGGKERIRAFIDRFDPPRPPDASGLITRLHHRKTALYLDYLARHGIPLRPGMADLIANARAAGLKLAIATTTNLPNVEGLLSRALGSRWRQAFPVVIAGDMVAAKKPAPDVYLAALEALGLPASRCLALEDSTHGIASARAAGLAVIACRSAYLPNDDLSGARRIFEPGDIPTLPLIEASASAADA